MKKAFALLLLPFLLMAVTGPFIDGHLASTATHLYKDPSVIHMPCGIDVDTRAPEIDLPTNLVLSAPQEGMGTYVVQFDGPIYSHERRALEQTGAVIEGYLPNYTYIVRMDALSHSKVENLSGVRWTGPYQPGYKIAPDIDLEKTSPEKLVVTLYAGVDGNVIAQTVEDLGGKFLQWQGTDFQTFAHILLSPDKVGELVQHPQIKWIEPFRQHYIMNGRAQWVIQTWEENNRRIWDEGLTGEGQILSTLDTGIKTTHNFFRDPSESITDFGDFPDHRKIIAYKKPAYDPDGIITFGDEGGHGTHTAGSVLGNDQPVGGSSANIGMAPDARIYFLDGGGGGGGIIHAVSLEYSLSIPYNGNSAGGARIISNSWGNQSVRYYDKSCVESDQTMWNRPTYLVMYSGGNTDRGQYTGSPANAKSVVAVGGCRNGLAANSYWPGSSTGPSGDGRIRPDLVTPGENVTSASITSNDAEVTYSGTSMSSPIAAGNAGLIRQYFTDGWYPDGSEGGDGFEPSAALVKGMMINSVETDFFSTLDEVPSNRVGWGRPKLDNVMYFPGDARKLAVVDFDQGLETGYQFLGTIQVEGSSEPLRVTLNWTDFPGAQYASPALVNDLNLEVVSPTGTTYRGNNFEDNHSVEGDDFDNDNPTENVFVDGPETGTWKIHVHGNNVPSGPQPFALVVTGELGTFLSSASIGEVVVDDQGQSEPNGNMDPGEDVTIYVEIVNAGDEDLSNVAATLSTTSSDVTITDNSASYGNIASGESAQGEGFAVSVSSSAELETWVEFNLDITSGELSGSLGSFELMIGTPKFEYADHDVGNVLLTVTKHGSIGFLNINEDGRGFLYPDNYPVSWLYHSTFASGNSSTYINDRFYGDDAQNTNAEDWEVSIDPDGMVIIGQRYVSDQDSRAIFTDAGNDNSQGLRVYQYGYAWALKDYVILKYVLENTGTSDLNGMYAGILADFDMGANAASNHAGTDQSLNLAYMKQGNDDNPHVGIKLLKGTKANVSLLENPVYVYQGSNHVWDEETCFDFINGGLSFEADPDTTDWSVVVSAGPFDLPPGATDTVSFAFLAGDDLNDLKANATDAQDNWDTLKFTSVEEHHFTPTNLTLGLSPELITGKGSIRFSIPSASPVRIDIYDLTGRRIRSLLNDDLSAGSHEIHWDGRDSKGATVSNGVYFISLRAGEKKIVGKTVIVR